MKNELVATSLSARVNWRVRLVGAALMVVIGLGVLEGAAYAYLRLFAGYDGRYLMNYQFDDYKNVQLTPGYRNTRGVVHNNQGFRRTTRERPLVLRVPAPGGGVLVPASEMPIDIVSYAERRSRAAS